MQALNLVLIQIEECLSAFVAYRMRRLVVPKKLIEEIDSAPDNPPKCPPGQCKMYLRVKPAVQEKVSAALTNVRVGTSPAMKPIVGGGYIQLLDKKKTANEEFNENTPTVIATPVAGTSLPGTTQIVFPSLMSATGLTASGTSGTQNFAFAKKKQITQILQTTSGKHIILTPSGEYFFMVSRMNLFFNQSISFLQLSHIPTNVSC